MAEQLEATVNLTNQKVQFTGVSRSNPAIICDYNPPLGDGQGYTGLEWLMFPKKPMKWSRKNSMHG